MNLTDEMAEETIDVINAALENLGLDLRSGDESALGVIRAFTGKVDLTAEQAEDLLAEVDARFTEFAKDVVG
jgi:hypothetical protein